MLCPPRNRCGNGICTKQHEANRDGYTSRGQPSNFQKITHLPFRNRSPWIPPQALAPSCGTAKQANPSLDLPLFGTANQAPTPPSLELPSSPYAPPNPLLQPRPLVYPPVHQASSGGYPPHPTGHPSKNAIFLLFVRVRNDKNTTHIAKFAPSLGPCPYHLPPPGTEALGPPPPRALAPPSQPFPDPQTARGKPRQLRHKVNPPTFEK